MAKFKKGDKVYMDGPYGRAVWKILDVIPKQGVYRAKVVDDRGLPASLKKPFREWIKTTDMTFSLLTPKTGPWVKTEFPSAEKLVEIGLFGRLS